MHINALLRRMGFLLSIVSALLLITFQTALAKGNFARITIQLPDSNTEVEVSDPAYLSFWTFSDLADGTREAPPVDGPGYEVTRWGLSQDGTYVAWDRLRYYHGSSATSGRGWILYEGLVDGHSGYDGQWFTSTRSADALMENIIYSKPVQNQNASTSPPQPGFPVPELVAIAAASLIGVIATVAFIRRREHLHTGTGRA